MGVLAGWAHTAVLTTTRRTTRNGLVAAAVAAAVAGAPGAAFSPMPAEAAAGCVVTGAGEPQETLQAAVDAAAAGATLRVSGTCYGPTTINKDLSIVGRSNNGSRPATLNGNRAGSVITNEGATLALRDLTITNGDTEAARTELGGAVNPHAEKGGGINNEEGVLTLTNTVVTGNTESWAGHGFSGETAGGGGIYNESGSVTLIRSIVSANSGGPGGGIDNVDGTVRLHRTTVSENEATTRDGGMVDDEAGAGIYSFNGSLTLTNHSTVSDNHLARGCGAGICSTGTNVRLADSMVVGNTLETGSGAGIYSSGVLTVDKAVIAGNTIAYSETFSDSEGGGIYNEGTLVIRSSSVSDNAANQGEGQRTAEGGGIYSSSSLTIGDSTVQGNTSRLGGGIYNSAALTLAGSSSVTENKASESGGGIFDDQSEGATIRYVRWSGTISDNEPDNIFTG